MIITYVKLYLSMKIILNESLVKEGVTFDLCFSWWNGYYLCICLEARIKKCYKLNLYYFYEPGSFSLAFLSF